MNSKTVKKEAAVAPYAVHLRGSTEPDGMNSPQSSAMWAPTAAAWLRRRRHSMQRSVSPASTKKRCRQVAGLRGRRRKSPHYRPFKKKKRKSTREGMGEDRVCVGGGWGGSGVSYNSH